VPSGAAVIPRQGKGGKSWCIKYRDAAGRQVWETLGREPEWSEARAQRELGKRLDAVERDRWRKPERTTFGEFAVRYEAEYLPGRNLKASTVSDYGSIIHRHLVPHLGHLQLAALEPADVDGYVAAQAAAGLTPKTIRNHLALLRVMLKVARRWRLTRVDPLAEVEPPRAEQPEMQVLTEAEIARLLTAYRELEAEAPWAHREWWALSRRLVEVALGTALRCGELLALRWRDIELLDERLHVREALVRGRFTTPKSKASRRTIGLGPRTAAVLQEQWQASRYRADDSLVFAHPHLGSPLDPAKMSREHMRPALRRAGITKPFRPFHDLRHTALTHEAAAGNPQAYVQAKAGHSQGTITERYIHAAQVAFPDAASRAEERMFGTPSGSKSGSN
jgi:integrase